MEGIVSSWRQTADHGNGWIADAGDNWYYAAGREVEPDSIGRVMLVPGEPVEFEVVRGLKKNGKKFRNAINIRRPFKTTDIDPRTHRELCVVKNKNWLLRQFGGLLTVDYLDQDALVDGSVVECGVEPQSEFTTWRATNIRFIALSEDDVDWDSVEAQS